MLTNKYTRTTISVPENLLFEIKKKALMEKKTITEVISDNLSLMLGKNIPNRKPIDIEALFGVWGNGVSGTKFLKKVRKARMGFSLVEEAV